MIQLLELNIVTRQTIDIVLFSYRQNREFANTIPVIRYIYIYSPVFLNNVRVENFRTNWGIT